MLLFDIIRDWFVMYIWGGITSTGDNYDVSYGFRYWVSDGVMDGDSGTLDYLLFKTNFYDSVGDNADIYMSISDWLSTTSTIIVLILLCIVFGLMVRWLFRLTSGLLQGKC